MNKKLIAFLFCTIGVTNSALYAGGFVSKSIEEKELPKNTSEIFELREEEKNSTSQLEALEDGKEKKTLQETENTAVHCPTESEMFHESSKEPTSDTTAARLNDETFFTKASQVLRREFLPTLFTTAMSAIVYNEYTQYTQTPAMEFPISIIPVSALALMEMRNIADRFLSKTPSPWSFVPQSIRGVVETGALLVPGAIAYAYGKKVSPDPELSSQVIQCVQSCLTEMNDL